LKLTKDVSLVQLQAELIAAGVDVKGLGTTGSLKDGTEEVHTFDDAGAPVDLPQAASAVIAAHTPPQPPPAPDFGGDAAMPAQIAGAVTQLRQYLQITSPSQAQNAAALKLVIRGLFVLLQRSL
jgi:hypothetical protein